MLETFKMQHQTFTISRNRSVWVHLKPTRPKHQNVNVSASMLTGGTCNTKKLPNPNQRRLKNSKTLLGDERAGANNVLKVCVQLYLRTCRSSLTTTCIKTHRYPRPFSVFRHLRQWRGEGWCDPLAFRN